MHRTLYALAIAAAVGIVAAVVDAIAHRAMVPAYAPPLVASLVVGPTRSSGCACSPAAQSASTASSPAAEIVREASCPVIAILHADDPAYVHEAAKRGVFAYIVEAPPTNCKARSTSRSSASPSTRASKEHSDAAP